MIRQHVQTRSKGRLINRWQIAQPPAYGPFPASVRYTEFNKFFGKESVVIALKILANANVRDNFVGHGDFESRRFYPELMGVRARRQQQQ